MTDVLAREWLHRDRFDTSKDTIVSRFERQVAAAPDKLAVVTDEALLSYRELDLKANHIAAVLASLPSQRDRPIALLMNDDAARVATMLGALKANRIFIPLAPNSPGKWVTSRPRRLRNSADHRRSFYPLGRRACGHQQRHSHGDRAARSIIAAICGRSNRLSRGYCLCRLYFRFDWPAKGRGQQSSVVDTNL